MNHTFDLSFIGGRHFKVTVDNVSAVFMAQLVQKCHRFRRLHLTFIFLVYLVPQNKSYRHFTITFTLIRTLSNPIFQVLEGFAIAHIVYNQNALNVPVIRTRYGPIPLQSSRVLHTHVNGLDSSNITLLTQNVTLQRSLPILRRLVFKSTPIVACVKRDPNTSSQYFRTKDDLPTPCDPITRSFKSWSDI